MNRSGEVVPELLHRCRLGPESLLVVCDNLDLPPGQCRLKLKGGSGGHHGLESVTRSLGTGDYCRLYVGIGRPVDGEIIRHVLENPAVAERTLYDEAVARAAQSVVRLLSATPQQVMNELNQRAPRTSPEG